MVENKIIDILLIEDNLGDIKLFTDALEETGLRTDFQCVRDGVDALKFLHKKPPFENAPDPSIIILDLNLPSKDGRSVLAEIKADPILSLTPVIILSGSDAPQDISTCYALHANCYIIKPRDLFGMNETVRSLVDFWLQKVTLPLTPKPRNEAGGNA